MIKALIAEKDDISLYAYIDEPTNLVKYYTVNNEKFFSYTKAKNYYDMMLKGESNGNK